MKALLTRYAVLALGLAGIVFALDVLPKVLVLVFGLAYGAMGALITEGPRRQRMMGQIATAVAEDAIEQLKDKAEKAHLN